MIEIAIVIIIIALLSGGVFKGLELVEDSRNNKFIDQIQSLSTAWFGYINRYQNIPGDDSLAENHLGTSATNGDGDGQISGTEQPLVWQHLHLSQIITGSGVNPTLTPWGASFFFEDNGTQGGHRLCVESMQGARALFADRSLDDGSPSSGRVVADPDPGEGVAYTLDASYKICSRL